MSSDPAVRALAAQLAQLRGRLDELEKKQAELADGDEPGPHAAYATNWLELSPEEHAQRLDGLRQWVDEVLAVQYPHVYLRPCWPAHPAAKWELGALRTEWYRIFNRKYPDHAGQLAFNDRWLPGVASRMESRILKDCKDRCALLRTQSQVPPRPRPRAV